VKTHRSVAGRKTKARAAFTLVEGLVAISMVGVGFLALYSGLTYGFSRIQLAREDFRATQILVEKMETIRLYNWAQINDRNYVPNTFTASYYPPGAQSGNSQSSGVVYTGKLEIKDSQLDSNYRDAVREVVLTLTWKSGKLKRSRSLSTYVAEFGLHNHVY